MVMLCVSFLAIARHEPDCPELVFHEKKRKKEEKKTKKMIFIIDTLVRKPRSYVIHNSYLVYNSQFILQSTFFINKYELCRVRKNYEV